MRLRRTTALFAIIVVAVAIVAAGCGGGGSGTNPPAGNQAPVIESLNAPDQAFPGSISTITVNATDADGDSLSYEWSASSGAVEGTGNSVNWTAPVASGNYTITVTVRDGNGGQAQRSATIAVEDIGPPPLPPWPAG